MAKGDLYIHQKVRQLCRDIHKRADDRQELQILLIRLQDALREEQYKAQPLTLAPPRGEDPFDKILVA
jgi:hypothetical protein